MFSLSLFDLFQEPDSWELEDEETVEAEKEMASFFLKKPKITLNIVLSFQKIKQGGLQIDSLIKCCVSAQVRLIVGALIGGDIHFI